MKYIKILLTILLSLILTSGTYSRIYEITLYCADKSNMTLYPVAKKIYAAGKADLCRKILDELMVLEKNPRNLQLIPGDINVSVSDNTANIDFAPFSPSSDSYNLLTIYSIVNSLTSSGDIITVEFTLGGKKTDDFCNAVDMTETFIPDYDICS